MHGFTSLRAETAHRSNWADDCQQGREEAKTLIQSAASNPDSLPSAIAKIRTIVEQGRFSGVEVGFFQTLLEAAISD